nr:leucine-rich repeat protein [uncultured Carboxylicivirga sp.]
MKSLLIPFFILISLHVWAENYTITLNDVIFDQATGTIVQFNNYTEKDITIPSFFNVDGTDVEIKIIGNNAFSFKFLSSVNLPSTITRIEYMAFNYNNLSSIDLPDGITTIGNEAFANNYINTLLLPSSLTEIGYGAFENNQLSSINIPSNITEIKAYTFSQNQISSVIIPENIVSIERFAFYSNQISSLTIPNTITFIGEAAFNKNAITTINGESSDGIIYLRNEDGTEDLSAIISYGGTSKAIDFIPSSVVSINEMAFTGNSITSLIIPETITEIQYNAFASNAITTLSIPNNVKSLGSFAFAFNSLSSISLPESISDIGFGLVNGNAITEINGIPSNGILFGRNFDGTEDPTIVTSYGGVSDIIDFIPETVKTIGEHSFILNNLTSVTIPEGVTCIRDLAFQNNKITTLNLPNSLHYIGYQAFFLNSINSITIPENVICINEGAFLMNSLSNFYLPTHSELSSKGWKDAAGNTYYSNEKVTNLSTSYRIPDIYHIEYNLNGGALTSENPYYYEKNSGISSFNAPAHNNYDFSGWYNNDDLIESITPGYEGDIFLSAKWDLANNIQKESKALEIFPNPTDGYLNIKYGNGFSIEVIDLSGSILYNEKISSGSINLSNICTPGIYILKVEDIDSKKIMTRKIVIK